MDNINMKGLENQLAGSLRPIKPRVEFITGVGQRLRGLKRSILVVSTDTWKFILLMLAGALSLGFLLAFLGRFLFNLFEVRKRGSERS